MLRALLDVNVLIALCDGYHEHHKLATQWLLAHADAGWASCPLTQNGAIRIMSQPKYPNPRPISDVMAQIQAMCQGPSHLFWPDNVSLIDSQSFHQKLIHGHNQITDLYLLGLAVKHGGRFITIDGAIPLTPVVGAKTQHLMKI